jgi:hypothetical protein
MPKPIADPANDYRFLLSTSPPSRNQTRLAALVLLLLFVALVITVPFARKPLANTEVMLPAYAAAVLVNKVITAALLLALFSVQRSPAILILSVGYPF